MTQGLKKTTIFKKKLNSVKVDNNQNKPGLTDEDDDDSPIPP